MSVNVVGGVYREISMWPGDDVVFGSAGRAAAAIATFGTPVTLHTYSNPQNLEVYRGSVGFLPVTVEARACVGQVSFFYTHGLATPRINLPEKDLPALRVKAPNILRFGMLESDAVVDADKAVYDPQDPNRPESFAANGSTARRLAVILNEREVAVFSERAAGTLREQAAVVAERERAEVVVVKRGARGAWVWDRGEVAEVPAFDTARVWKIGSGDHFAAHFAQRWMMEGLPAISAAELASKATALYCESRLFPSVEDVLSFSGAALRPTKEAPAQVYLAGPFFSLAQRWLVEEAYTNLRSAGLAVFSPLHDVGRGSAEDVAEKDLDGLGACGVVLAILDGLDAGTIFEIGYAKALGKDVVIYVENEGAEDLKMMQGSHCRIVDDYVSAIYRTVWTALGT